MVSFSGSSSLVRRCALCCAVAVACAAAMMLPGTGAPDALPAGAAQVAGFEPSDFDLEPEFSTWGVVGKGPNLHAEQDGFHNPNLPDRDWSGPQPEVWDTQEHLGKMFVGGIFTGVRRNESWYPNDPVHDQSYLAAFDLDGNWIPGFGPVFNGPVYDMAVAPNGSLLVGGEFTQVNGQARAGLVALDPNTGAIDNGFSAGIVRLWGDPTAYVKELLVDGSDLYVMGDFTHIARGGNNHRVWSSARLNASSGALDNTWLPNTTGSGIYDIALDPTRGQAHLVGYFSALDGLPDTDRVGTVRLSDGSAIAGRGQHPFNTAWNQDQVGVTMFDDEYWTAGGNHWVVARNADTGTPTLIQDTTLDIAVTSGDGQVAEVIGDKVVTGHHARNQVRVWDPATHTSSDLVFALAKRTFGVWAIEMASDGCLWTGGDSTRTLSGEWLGGFARFCPNDNLALGRPATQSSDIGASTADKATDGRSVGHASSLTLSRTQAEAQPWWEVDLGSVRNIGDIELFRRTDCCTGRFADVHVLVSDTPFGGETLAEAKATPGVSDFFRAGTANRKTRHGVDRAGRYVRVQLEGTGALELAEVMVHEGTAPDTQDPSGPLGPDASTNNTSNTITWNRSNDNVGVTGYLINDNYKFVRYVAGADTTTWTHTGLAAGSLHRYQVRAQDAAGNVSIPSVRLDVITAEGVRVPDNIARNVSPSQINATSVLVDWDPPVNLGGISGYLVHDNYGFVKYVAGAGNTEYTHTGLVPASTHRYEIRAQGNGVTSLPTERVKITLN